ncbi:hypothetical protein [Bacillus massiliigorillae]|uniref:hypothetical protein n=1 Tax=Bacillus massiliigorillae TaxID=1243664 RepID=UPI0003A5CE97|nr:hypothetical protein [Bacillus massiliigorillae]
MSHKPVVKVSFNEDAQEESVYFLKRLIEKIILDELELPPQMKGAFLLHNKDIMEKE